MKERLESLEVWEGSLSQGEKRRKLGKVGGRGSGVRVGAHSSLRTAECPKRLTSWWRSGRGSTVHSSQAGNRKRGQGETAGPAPRSHVPPAGTRLGWGPVPQPGVLGWGEETRRSSRRVSRVCQTPVHAPPPQTDVWDVHIHGPAPGRPRRTTGPAWEPCRSPSAAAETSPVCLCSAGAVLLCTQQVKGC